MKKLKKITLPKEETAEQNETALTIVEPEDGAEPLWKAPKWFEKAKENSNPDECVRE